MTAMAVLVPDCRVIFDFSATAEHILTKNDKKQALKVLYQVCVFRADQLTKMVALVSDVKRIIGF